MDELEKVFEGLDGARPLPAGLRRNLARAIDEAARAPLAEHSSEGEHDVEGAPLGAEPLHGAARELGGTSPWLPDGLAASLADVLTDPMVGVLDGLDGPRPLPPHLRARLEGALAPRRAAPRWLSVAAAIVLVAGTATALLHPGGTGPNRHAVSSGVALAPPPSPRSPDHTVSGGAAGAGAAPSTSLTRPVPPLGSASSAAAGAGGATGPDTGPAPPFAFGPTGASATAAMPDGAAPSPRAPSATISPTPLTVAVVGGDPAEQSGFDAYVSLLNQDGGVNGHPVRTVTTGASSPVAGAVATVNLADGPVGGIAGPVLETLAVPDGVLRGSVFDTASAPAHQAVALVDTMFAAKSSGVVAVYRGTSGVWAAEVPDALAAALRARGITPLVMAYVPGQPLSTPPAAAALLALDTASAGSWFTAAARAGYHPPVAGLESLAEPSLAPTVPDGTRVLTPYSLAAGPELQTIGSRTGSSPGAAAVHGWVSAKVLAVALWRSHATTAEETAAALTGMAGYDDGFSPPLAFRPGTNSRVPDGTVITVVHHAFAGGGPFVRDPA